MFQKICRQNINSGTSVAKIPSDALVKATICPYLSFLQKQESSLPARCTQTGDFRLGL